MPCKTLGSHPEHHVHLNSSASADILWWHLFTADWNSMSMLWDIERLLPEFNTVPDVSGLAIHKLDQAVWFYYESGLSSPTHKTYEAAKRKYLNFCNSFSIQPLPTTENILRYFVACLGQESLAHSTVRTYLSGDHSDSNRKWLPRPPHRSNASPMPSP